MTIDRWSDDPDLGQVVVAEDVLQKRVAELGDQLTAEYDDRPPLLVGVLKGAFVFMSDLARAIQMPPGAGAGAAGAAVAAAAATTPKRRRCRPNLE